MDTKNKDLLTGVSLKSNKLNKKEIFFPSKHNPVFNLDLVDRFEIDKKGLLSINIGPIGLKRKNDFVGIAGFYYKPSYFGCKDVTTFIDSWNWFLKKVSINEEEFTQLLEASSIIHLLIVGFDEGLIFYLFALIHDLFLLNSLHVDVEQKILEIRRKIMGNLRSYSKWKNKKISEGFKRIQFLKSDLANLSSESGLAIFAKLQGFSVKMGISPDLVIEQKKIEVKNRVTPQRMIVVGLSETPDIVEHNNLDNLKNSFDRGLKQKPDIVAIEVSNLDKREVKGYKLTWMARGNLKKILRNTLDFTKKGKLVLLFMVNDKEVSGRLVIIKKIRPTS